MTYLGKTLVAVDIPRRATPVGGLSFSFSLNTLRTGAFKLFKCTFPGSKRFKSTFVLCFFKYL